MGMNEQPGRQRVTRATLRSYYPDGAYTRRLQPLPDHRCIYVKNPKAGTSTVLLWLYRIHTGDHGFQPDSSIHAEHTLPRPKEVGLSTVARMLNGDAIRFTFVRDPIKRVESAYRDKILRHRRYRGRAHLQRLLGLPEDPRQDITLDQFVAALEMQDPIRMDPHWRPQHLNLMHPLITYDVIGRLESFSADLARVRELTGMPWAPVDVQSATRQSASSLLAGHPALLRKVREIYAEDFALYGY